MEHILDLDLQSDQLFAVFKKIQESNALLFLGAGASVGEKKYLSREVIEYYEAKIGKSIQEPDIVKFLDILSADSNFNRAHFDGFVVKLLQKLNVTEGHKILASIPWREIITTNYDLLVEMAYDEISSTSNKQFDIKVIRSLKDYNYRESNSEVRYVKLNGCVKDTGQFPLAFSTEDFRKLKSFHRAALNDLKNLGQDVIFISIGYSYSDSFGKGLLEGFDSYNYRERKWMINVDPFPNESALDYYKSQRVCIVKSSFQDFFQRYRNWEQGQENVLIKKKGLSFSNSQGHYITMPTKLLVNLDGVIRQLNSQTNSRERFVKDSDFYKGEEPTFSIITRGVDVVKSQYIEKFKNEIRDTLESNHKTIIPIFFIVGDFGIGKSTFAYRLIYELEKDAGLDLVAFEIENFNKIRRELVIELINTCKSKNVVFLCDEVEIESNFKVLIDLQSDISIEQFQDCNVFFFVPIRENILEKYKLTRTIPRSHLLKVGGSLEYSEVSELLDKLRNAELISFRDAEEKNRLIRKVRSEYDSDSFISLMEIITGGRHQNDLVESHDQLSPDAQKAFLYTALVHKHKLLMPASWLKKNISMDWDEFTTKVIKAEGKGLLIQEMRPSYGTQPDLHFRTKHPLIAEKLVNRIVPNKDKQFQFYEKMLQTIEIGQSNSYLVTNLLKALAKNEEYNDTQLSRLYDAAYKRLSDDPYFLLNYAINLQHRRNVSDLKRALDLLIYAESLLDFRNHRFIHRRGVISFDLAKLYFEDKNQMTSVNYYLSEAQDLFLTKQLLDPFSSYSYYDYIKALIWELEMIEHDDEDEIQRQIQIEELFDLAGRTVTDGLERIDTLQNQYARYLGELAHDKSYKDYLDELYSVFRLKPYACILLYNYYENGEDEESCKKLVEEMEYYQENFEILKFLLKYYGRNLHEPNTRVKFQRLCRENPGLEDKNPLRFNFLNFIAETYNRHFIEGRNYLNSIQTKFYNINPEYHLYWLDSLGNEVLFDAKVIKNSNEKFKAVKVSSIQQTIRLVKGKYDSFALGTNVKVRLHFYLYGLMAEILNESSKED